MPHEFAQQPRATPPNYPNHDSGDEQEEGPFFFPDLEGAAFRSKATTFAVIGIFFFGVIFGPLAIRNAAKAEALGVRAPFGRICGWIVLVGNGLNICLFILGAVLALSGVFDRSPETVESKVKAVAEGARDLQGELPMQLDPVTSLTGIEAEGDAIRYDYVVNASVDPSTVSADSLRSMLLPTMCASASTKEILDAGIKMKHAYVFEGSTKSLDFTVTKAECAIR
ncbi:hypothetical protein LFT48_08815 [Arthrobacter sp. FW305-123]|nr:hypothetical protein LFT48_08815 [Arthrobacter sp. FW305-123]